MGKTYKKYPWNYYRKPRGKKEAVINEARNKAVPPDTYDDVYHDEICYVAQKVALRLHQKGYNFDEILNHLRKKYNYTQQMAEEVIAYEIKEGYWYQCKCDKCIEKMKK